MILQIPTLPGNDLRLPQCLRIAIFEGWRAWFHDQQNCRCSHRHAPSRFTINVGVIGFWQDGVPYCDGWAEWQVLTEDPEEAERVWGKALEFLRKEVKSHESVLS